MLSQRLPETCLLLQTEDLEAASASIERLYAPFSWRLPRSRPGPHDSIRIHTTHWGPLQPSMIGYGRDIDIQPRGLGGALLVTTVLKGRLQQDNKSSSLGGGPGTVLLATEDDCPTFHYGRHTEVLKLAFSQLRINTLCWELLGRHERQPVRFEAAALSPSSAQRWLELITYLTASVSSPALGGTDRLAHGLEEMLVLHLLSTSSHNHLETLSRTTPVLASREYHRACAYMEENLHESLTMLDIATAVGCSVRSLSRAFQHAHDTTPMRHLTELRLQRVRTLLQTLEHRRDMTIAQAAMHCGFSHLGEFHQQYRRRFGESPSQTRSGK